MRTNCRRRNGVIHPIDEQSACVLDWYVFNQKLNEKNGVSSFPHLRFLFLFRYGPCADKLIFSEHQAAMDICLMKSEVNQLRHYDDAAKKEAEYKEKRKQLLKKLQPLIISLQGK